MLFDFQTNEFHCTFCGELVEEDTSVLPQQDSRVMLANFNEVMEPFYSILRELDGIRLAPELLEPEPTRILGFVRYTLFTLYDNYKLLILQCLLIDWNHQTRLSLQAANKAMAQIDGVLIKCEILIQIALKWKSLLVKIFKITVLLSKNDQFG